MQIQITMTDSEFEEYMKLKKNKADIEDYLYNKFYKYSEITNIEESTEKQFRVAGFGLSEKEYTYKTISLDLTRIDTSNIPATEIAAALRQILLILGTHKIVRKEPKN